MLNERGLRTGAGDAFETLSVQWVRYAHKLKSLKQRLLDDGWLTGRQTEAKLDVKRSTLGRWRTRGQIKARICNDLGEWVYWLTPETEACLTNATPIQKDSSTAGGAV